MSALILALLGSSVAPDSVVVFPDRAQVTRNTSFDCGSRVALSFTSIPPSAGADSFRARVEGGTVDALRAELKSRQKEFSSRVAALEEQLELLDAERKVLGDEQSKLQEQEQLANQYLQVATQFVNREMTQEKPDVKAWQTAFDFSYASKIGSAKAMASLQKKLKELSRKREEIELQLSNARGSSNKSEYVVEILASCPKGKKASIALTYLVGGSSWTPAYEARADETQGVIDLSTFATIVQGSGEDWSNVGLTLSTALPAQDATPPQLNKLIVGSYEKAPEKKVLVRRDEFVEHAEIGRVSKEEAPSGGKAKEQGLSVQLEVTSRSSVRGDNTAVRVFVGKSRMKAEFELRATPKLFPVAFRVAQLTNQGAWPLLPGTIDVFRNTGLVGRLNLPRVAQGAPMTLSLGIEDSIRLKRTVVEELTRDVGVFSDKKRFNYVYKFDVSNYGKSNAQVTLVDHLPVSEMADISVSVSEKTTTGYELTRDDGMAKWKIVLKPNEKKSIDFGFRVDVPNSYDFGGL